MQEHSVDSTKTEYMVILNVICCLAVVFLHVNGCFWEYSEAEYWKSADVIESVFYFAVPCFFMMTGANLIDYRERYSTRKYFAKRIKKTVIPFIAWSIIGIAYCTFVARTVNTSDWSVKNIYNDIMSTSVILIYWFFPSLYCAYMCIPVFSAVSQGLRKEVFSYLVAVGFVVNALIPFVNNTFSLGLSWPLTLSAVAGNIIFLPLGYLINEYEISKPKRLFTYVLSITSLLVHMFGTYFLSRKAGYIVSYFKGYSGVSSVLYATGIFVWFRYNGHKLMNISWINRASSRISKYTFGVYLVHWYLYDYSIRALGIDKTSLVFRLVGPFIIMAISVAIIWIMKKIPVIKNIVP